MAQTQRRRSRRLRPPAPAAQVILKALSQVGLGEQARRLRVFQCWDEAVGPEIAARTSPQSFRHGVLIVKSATASWQNELVFLRTDILAKLNALLGKRWVRELKVISGYVPPPERARLEARRAAPAPEDLQAARDTSLPIGDPEVRAAFEKLMATDRAARRQGRLRRRDD